MERLMPRSLTVREYLQNARQALMRGAVAIRRAIVTHPRSALAVLAVGVGVFATFAPAYAQSSGVCSNATDLSCQVLNYIVIALGSIAYALGGLAMGINLVFAWLLISFAKFNTFVGAQPVVIGWPLVRDVVNMFFIVVLLVVAFSTIIGYQEFHYKGVLPKLLLMAVLINFSKTLVGVMIDFSQVITLTFVNGFAQAAFGNFAKAFQLSNILTLSSNPNPVTSSAAVQDNFSVLMSLVFGIVIMFFTATVLLIMCIYFLVRIVLLWMLLIFSPIAFFSLALPGKMQKAISQLSSKWWSDLGSLLTGGPIVAFFLWLTLAVIQSSAQPFTGLYSPATTTESAALSPTITKASDPSNLATMMVAIIMLLTGLNTAIAVSKAAAPKLGELAQNIKSAGGPVGVAARLSYAGARGAGRAADRRFQVSERAGAGLLRTGQAVARIPVIGGLAGAGITRAGGALRGIGVTERAAATRAFEERTRHLNPEQRLQALDAEIARAESNVPLVGNRRAADALIVQKGLLMKEGPAIKARSSAYEEEYRGRTMAPGESREEHEAKAKAFGSAQAKREAGMALSAAIASAEGFGDTGTADKLKDAQSKDPSLHSDLGSLSKVAANKIDDYKQAFKEVKTEAWQDSGTFLAYMKASGLVDEKTGAMKAGYQDDDKWKELTSAAGGNRTKYVQAQVAALETDDGRNRAMKQLAAMSKPDDKDAQKAGNDARQLVSFATFSEKDAQGKTIQTVPFTAYAEMKAGGAVNLEHGERGIKDFSDFTRGMDTKMRDAMQQALTGVGVTGSKLDEFARRFNRTATAEQAQHVTRNAAVYANPPTQFVAPPPARSAAELVQSQAQIGEYNRQVGILASGQAMGIPAPPQSQKVVLNYAMEKATSENPVDKLNAAKVVANIDPAGVDKNPQIKQAIAEALDGKLDQFAEAYKASKNDPESMKKIEGVVKSVHEAAQKAVNVAQKSGAQISELDQKMVNISEEMKKQTVLKKISARSKKA